MSPIAAIAVPGTNKAVNTTTALRPLPTIIATGQVLPTQRTRAIATDTFRTSAPLAHINVVGAQPRVDASSRIGIGKPAEALNWDKDTLLFADNDGSVVIVTEVHPGQHPNVRLDTQARLTLNPGAVWALGATKFAQVQVIADLTKGRLVLVSLDTVLHHALKEAD